MVLDDRVTRVTAMSTKKPSYAHPEIDRADMQLALMKTEKDAVLRMACGYTQPLPPLWEHHHYQVMGTGGMLQTGRTSRDKAKMWLADSHMHDMADVDWRYERTDAPEEAVSSGHRGADYYVQVAFRDALTGQAAAGLRRLPGHGHSGPGHPGRRVDQERQRPIRRPRLPPKRLPPGRHPPHRGITPSPSTGEGWGEGGRRLAPA